MPFIVVFAERIVQASDHGVERSLALCAQPELRHESTTSSTEVIRTSLWR